MKKTAAKTHVMDLASLNRAVYLTLCLLAAYMMTITPAHAQVMCTVAGFAISNYGRGLSTLGVLSVGFGASLGKVSWTMAATVAGGIAVLSSANSIAGMLGGGC